MVRDLQEVVVNRLCLREAARLATVSRVWRQFFLSSISPEVAPLLDVLRRGVPGRITGPQLRFLLRLIQDALCGRLFSWYGPTGGREPPEDPRWGFGRRFFIDAEGRLWTRDLRLGCTKVYLGWRYTWQVHRTEGRQKIVVHTLPHCKVSVPGGALVEILGGRPKRHWSVGPLDRLPGHLANLTVYFEGCQVGDGEWVRSLMLGISLFIFEKGFEEREVTWEAVRRAGCTARRKTGSYRRRKTKTRIERAPRVVSVRIGEEDRVGAEEWRRVLAGMQGPLAAPHTFAYYHVGPRDLEQSLFHIEQEWLAAWDRLKYLAYLRRRLIWERIRAPGSGAILLVRVVSSTDSGIEAECVIPCRAREMKPFL